MFVDVYGKYTDAYNDDEVTFNPHNAEMFLFKAWRRKVVF